MIYNLDWIHASFWPKTRSFLKISCMLPFASELTNVKKSKHKTLKYELVVHNVITRWH